MLKYSRDVPTRFWARVVEDDSGCWFWCGRINPNGYGIFEIDYVQTLAHRYAYEFVHGPTDLYVLHICDKPSCVNPDHLIEGTPKENTQDMMLKGRHVCWNRGVSRFSDGDRRFVSEVLSVGAMSQRELASLFATSQTHIWRMTNVAGHRL